MNGWVSTERRPFLATLTLSLISLVMVVLAGGFAAAALVRYSPGFDIDENAWNPKIGKATLESIHSLRTRENRLPVFYVRYLRAALHGDLGESESLRIPVAELLRQRAPVSAHLIAWGTACGMLLSGLLAWLAVWPARRALEVPAASVSGLLLAIPAAILALGFFFAQWPLWMAVALAMLPRVFGTMREILNAIYLSPALLAARARGVSPSVLAWRYTLKPTLPQFMALAGLSLVLAFGSIVPIEALCDVPGIGQLAWKAALARDLPVLSALALIITFAVASVHTAGDLIG